jgi:hypothetical protein
VYHCTLRLALDVSSWRKVTITGGSMLHASMHVHDRELLKLGPCELICVET